MNLKKWLAAGSGIALGAWGAYTSLQYLREHQELLGKLIDGSQVIEIPNGRIEYAEQGEGPAILISHGTLGGYDQGLAIVGLFQDKGYRFISPSRAGYLRSAADTGWTPEAQADSFAQLLDALNISKAALIGISGGGPAAIQFALRHPGRCQGLVLLSAITRRPGPMPPVRNALAQAKDFSMHFDFPWWLLWRSGLKVLMVMNGADPRLAAEAVQDPEKLDALQKIYRPIASANLRLAGSRIDESQIRHLPHFPLGDISAPTLVVHSPTDALVSYPQAALTAREIPGAELLMLKNGGHICFVMRKEQFVPRVSEFLDTQFSRSP
jgi:pimeloyl-ACP methyl ester carboxylesterase